MGTSQKHMVTKQQPRSALPHLSFENFPVVVVDELKALRQKSDTKNYGAHDSGEWRRANDVDEQAIACLVSFVGGIVQERIVEYEQLVVAPIVDCISDLDVGGAIFHVVQVVQDAHRGAQVSKMLRSGDLFIEDRNPDRLNVLPWLMKRRNIQDCVDVDAIRSKKDHCSRKFISAFLQLTDKVLVFRDRYQALHLVLIRGRQILQPIDAFVDVRQRQQIQQNIERRQKPGPKSVANEIAPHRRQAQPLIAADVIGAACEVKDCDLGEEIRKRAENANREQHPPDKVFAYSGYAFSARQRLGNRAHAVHSVIAVPTFITVTQRTVSLETA